MGLSGYYGRCLTILVLLASCIARADYSENPQAQSFVDEMVTRHGLPRPELEALMVAAERQDAILAAIARPAERTKPWYEYRRIFLTEDRIEQGVEFAREHGEALARAQSEFGVPPEYILAILGVETRYGRHAGRYRVVDALATLAFDYPPRSAFFRRQLEEYLLLVREQHFDPLELTGSYAGAMGYGQFIASSYRDFAIDFDEDGVVDIISNPVDAIGSIANYFKRHGWRAGEKVVVRANLPSGLDHSLLVDPPKLLQTVAEMRSKGVKPAVGLKDDTAVAPFILQKQSGEELWLGLNNFYVITRYNHSKLYAMAVHELAQEIAARL